MGSMDSPSFVNVVSLLFVLQYYILNVGSIPNVLPVRFQNASGGIPFRPGLFSY